jgi:hypothetical protein
MSVAWMATIVSSEVPRAHWFWYRTLSRDVAWCRIRTYWGGDHVVAAGVSVGEVGVGDPTPHRSPRPPQGPTRNTPPTPKPTGIDYARLIDTAHQAQLARGVNYAALTRNDPHVHVPGQLDLLTGQEVTR